MKNLSLNLINNNSAASTLLDLLRFSSAFTVFLFHFYVPLPGYQAVMVFFVLSGYFISSTVLKNVKDNHWTWTDYLLRRITRLWIVLLPALILTFFWAKLQLGFFGEGLSPDNLKISHYINWGYFLGNIFFLQGILVKPFGLNGPLWSLSYEFWYYLLFPCLILLLTQQKKKGKIIYALVFITIALFVGQKIMLYFLVWLMGAVLPFLKPFNLKNPIIKYLILFFSFILAIISLNYKPDLGFSRDFTVGLTFAILIYLIISFFNTSTTTPPKYNVSKELAGFSYTLYLVHYPVANFLLTWLISPLWPFGKTTIFLKGTLAISVIIYAWMIAFLTERHTDKTRRAIKKLIHRNKIKPVEIPIQVTKAK